jgi:hypothetical protein
MNNRDQKIFAFHLFVVPALACVTLVAMNKTYRETTGGVIDCKLDARSLVLTNTFHQNPILIFKLYLTVQQGGLVFAFFTFSVRVPLRIVVSLSKEKKIKN